MATCTFIRATTKIICGVNKAEQLPLLCRRSRMFRARRSRNAAHGKAGQGNGARAAREEVAIADDAGNGDGAEDAKAKRLNPIKRKQMEGRVHEIEKEIARVEAAIAERETALQTFVSADETQRVSKELEEHRAELAALMDEWEELSSALEGAS